ncbi:MAG: LysR family transcriptional regulator [Burkholderiales bacterium]|nr:LysR family transcriptional regulator [Burkholderiales bacterium]
MLDELKAFVAVVDRTSLTKAADALALTQSAVSRRIQQLEEALGATLLDRSSRPPTATAIGWRIYQAGSTLLRDLDRLMSIPREDEEPSGIFRLGLPQLVADVALFDIAMQIKAKFPMLDLKCRTEWSTGLQLELARGDLDAAAVMLPAGSAQPVGMHAKFIATLDVLVVQSKRDPIVPRCARVADLAEQEWILNPQGCGYRAALQRSMEDVGKQLRLGVDMHGTETQLRLVAAGLGLGLAPQSLLATSNYVQDLAVVEVADFSLKLDIWLVHAIELGNLSRTLDVLDQVLSDAFAVRAIS